MCIRDRFLSHIPQKDYPAGALIAAYYIVSGVRGMERGTMSNSRDMDGNDVPADLELMRLAVPRRVYTLSQIEYVIDRLNWLYHNSCLLYTSPSPRDRTRSRMPSSA